MLLIKNCKVWMGNEFLERNILVGFDGKIQKIDVPSLLNEADEVLDAKGRHAIPGVIDAHVHCREPGMTNKEDFLTASMAAAAGGVTTMLDMPNTKPATTTTSLLEEKRKLAASKCIVNYGFHFGATSSNISEIKKARNIAAVKVYMGSSTGDLLVSQEDALDTIFQSGKTIAAHAESEETIAANAKLFGEAGVTDAAEMHLRIRSNEAAESEVLRAITIAKKNKTRLHICHMSTREEAAIIRNEKKKNQLISCEATPHHLFLTVDDTKEMGNYAKVNPPLRTRSDAAALWEAINEGTIDIIATDHAPHLREEKEKDYWEAPSGMPGLQTMLPLMLNAMNENRIQMGTLIRIVASNPAKIFKIKSKGYLAEGMDGDITIFDIKQEKTIKNNDMLYKCGWTPFNGQKVKGTVSTTIVNGKITYNNGLVNEQAKGKEAIFNDN